MSYEFVAICLGISKMSGHMEMLNSSGIIRRAIVVAPSPLKRSEAL